MREHAKRVAELKRTTSVNISGKCREKACPYPVFSQGRCRSHYADQSAEFSMTPSTTSAAISGLGRLFA
jgi:hypothetical protein